MSMTGSLMPFDNNNDVNNKNSKTKSSNSSKTSKVQIQPKQSNTSGGNGGNNVAGSSSSLGAGSGYSSRRKRPCFRAHLNSMWSVWYGLFGAGLQAYVAVLSAERFLAVVSKLPRLEVHAYLALTGAAVLLLPFFLTAAVFKIGNLANDGFKLGRHMSTCSADPPGVLLGAGNGVIRSLWQHGGPTAPFLHLTTAFFLLLPKLLMEARLIQLGHLPQDDVWRTDLDFMMVHNDRLVVLSFMTNGSSPLPTPLPSSASSVAPAPAVNSSPTAASNSTVHTNSTASTLALLGEPDETVELRSADWGPVSAEFLNYAIALLVYTVRYPAVFWHTNKAFAALFSFQLLANGMQSLVAYAGMCVLYKVQVVGAKEALPMLHCRINQNTDGGSPFLLNTHVTLALFILSNVLVLASSLVLYLYGYGRFSAFLDQERERRVIVLRHTRSSGGWGYFTHCAALCVLIAIAVCNAPLLYDYTVVYRCSLDGAVLANVIGAIMHLFFWVLLWLILTVKHRWSFKLRVTVGRAAVKSARSIRLVTDVDLVSAHHCDNGTAPLLVVGNGRTYTIADTSPKKAIMSVIQKAALERKAKAAQGGIGAGDSNDDGEEQIYWLRPKPPSPKTSPDSTSDRLTWINRKLSSNSSGTKHKVTFDDSLGSSGSRKGKSLLSKSPKSGGKGKNKHHSRGLDQLSESEDDGDYATLRELPLMGSIPSQSEDTASEDNKLLEQGMSDDTVTYARTNKDLAPVTYGDPSPPLTPEPTEDLPPPVTAPVTVTVHNNNPSADSHQFQGSVTPRCLRRADSGMPHEELTPRSDSVSTESSGSGGSPPCGNHSETSSGVHSNSSSENPHHHQPQATHEQDPAINGRKSTSVDDLTTSLEQPRVQPTWRSFSLQRNVAPPTSTSPPIIAPLKTTYGTQSSCVVGTNSNGQPIYSFGSVLLKQYNGPHVKAGPNINGIPSTSSNGTKEMVPPPNGCPAVLLETAAESTVVIRRKQSRPKTTDGNPQLVMKDEPFGRSTNMRMTSFTDDGSRTTMGEPFPSSSSTLPHYPTQPTPIATVYPHCSTMPLPSSSSGISSGVSAVHSVSNSAASTSCNSFPRQHTTIPTHHNGVRLFAGPNPFVKRFPPYHHQGTIMNGRPPQVVLAPIGTYGTMPASSTTTGSDMVQSNGLTGHHTFPHVIPAVKYNPQQHLHKQERDSANFSMASSGDSDQYLPHNT